MITRPSHVALRVPDLDASVAHAVNFLGLREVERVDGTSYLSEGARHHSLQYIQDDHSSFDHMAFQLEDAEQLKELRAKLEQGGTKILDDPVESGLADAFRAVAPSGHVFEFFAEMEEVPGQFHATGPPPKVFGHITLTAADPQAMREFAEGFLGFKTSDTIGTPGGDFVFMRCNAKHHSLAVAPGADGLHHYAWELQSLDAIGELADRLHPFGHTLIWGPGRHGPGDNVFIYHLDPAGAVVEHYTDMEVVDPDRTEGRWPDEPRTMNYWGPLPAIDFLSLTTVNTDRSRLETSNV